MRRLDRCPVCGSRDTAYDFSGRNVRVPGDPTLWRVDRCASCGHGFVNPQPSWEELWPSYGSDYEAYDPTHGSFGATVKQTAQEALQTGQVRHIPLPAGKRLLDVGCGAGWFLEVARELGAQAVGLEPSAAGAERARARGLDVFQGTIEEFAWHRQGKNSFDVITANHVLEHTPDPVESLRIMGSLVATDGYIWISVPNAACESCRSLRDRWHSTDLPLHLMQFTPRSLATAGARAGLALRRQYTYSLPRAVAASLRQRLRHRWLIPTRLTRRIAWIDDIYGPRQAARFDAKGAGEAILAEFVRPPEPDTRI